jgi:hypothetical protein
MNVNGKTDKTSDGKIALDLDVTPLMDRKVQLGRTVKMVLERDEDGTFRKWVELTVKEMQQAPLGAVWPPPAVPATPALACMAAPPRPPEPIKAPKSTEPPKEMPMACQPLCPVAPPAPAVAHVPPVYPHLLPHPVAFGGNPVPPPFALLGLIPPAGPSADPPVQPIPESKAYVLEAKTLQCTPAGKKIHGSVQQIGFRAEPCFRGQMVIAYKEAKLYRNCLLHVKATALKNERLHVEVIGVQAKAENTNNGEIALDLDVKPLLDRQVELGKTVKRVLERDEAGRPCKWVELMVKEMPQAATGVPMAAPLACQH